MEKKVIWFLGSNASGKTTQAKLIHEKFNGSLRKEIVEINFINSEGENDKTFCTIYDRTGHVGKMGESQCTGTDTLNTRDRVEMSYLYLIMHSTIEIIIIDGILATGTWSEMIHQVKTQHDIKSSIILLNFTTPFANFERLKQRRANKSGKLVEDIILEEKTEDNVSGKIKSFKSIFERTKEHFNVSVEIDAELSIKAIHQIITQKTKI